MSKRDRRQFTAEQKLEILREAEQPNVSVTEVCRRHGLVASVFYRWRAVAQTGSASAAEAGREAWSCKERSGRTA